MLKLVRPHQIYIADNGSTSEEEQECQRLCDELSEAYYEGTGQTPTYIHVVHISCGNKTLAQYATVHYLNEAYEAGKSMAKYVTILDDDVLVPEHWSYKTVDKLFEDPTKVCLAYPLSAANASVNMVTLHQDIEYLYGDCDRFAQSFFGNQLFASGALATWRIEPFLHVLNRHCTVFHGEDLEMGYVLHKLSSRKTEKLGLQDGARVGYVRDCIVPTLVPTCVVHWFDFLPYPLKKKYDIAPCSKCGEHSFWNQRIRSWDAANHSFCWKYIKVLFSFRGLLYPRKVFVRLICLWKIVGLLRDYSFFIGLIMMTVRGFFGNYCLIQGQNQEIYLVFIVDTLLIAWAFYFINLSVISFRLAPMEKRFRPEVLFMNPLLFTIQVVLMNAICSVLYAMFYYLFKPFPKQIREQIELKECHGEELQTCWKIKEGWENFTTTEDTGSTLLGLDTNNQDNSRELRIDTIVENPNVTRHRNTIRDVPSVSTLRDSSE